MTMNVEPWLVAKVDATLNEVKAGLVAPYPAQVGAPVSETLFDTLTNFFRNGPYRKVFVFADDGVDFQYDEDAQEGDDIDVETDNDAIFDYVLARLEAEFGPALGHFPVRRDSIMDVVDDDDDDDDDEEERTTDDGTEWTPEHDQGALIDCDSYRSRYWVIEDQYVFLQGGSITGDDNMAAFVALTITPPVGPACLEGYWP